MEQPDESMQGFDVPAETLPEIHASEPHIPGPASAPHPTTAIVDAWFAELMHGSPVSRDTQIYNHVRQAVLELKRRLQEV